MNMKFKIIQSRAIYTTLWYIISLVSYPISKHTLSNVKSTSSFEQFLRMAFSVTLIIFKNISVSLA